MKHSLTQIGAVKRIETFFSKPERNIISVQELYIKAERNLEEEKKNKVWLKNLIYSLRQYNLITTQTGYVNGKKRVKSVGLSDQGKIALGRKEGKIEPIILQASPSIKTETEHIDKNQQIEIAQLMTKLSKDNPDRDITYNINGGTISLRQIKE